MRSLFQAIEKHSLKFKLTAIITGLVLFISFGLSFVFLVNEFYRYKERMQKEARLVIASVGRASLPFLISANHLLLQEMIGAFRGEKNIHALWVADAQGHILAHSDPQRVGERVKGWNALRQNILQEPLLMTEDLEKGVLQVFLAVQRAGQTWGIVGLEYSALPLRTQLTLLAGETLAVTLAFVLLGLWLGAVISARISRPLSELTRAAVRLESGVFEIDIDVDSADEVGILKQRFLKMAEALNLSQKELQQKNEALNRLNRELAWRVEEATRELRQTKDYLSYILASTREGIITTDQEGMIKTMNRAALAILGPLSTSEEPQKLWDLYPGVAGLEETFQETLRSGKVGQFQCTLRGAGQGERIVETTLTPLKDDKGMLLGGVVVLNDVTQRQRDEAELIRSEKLASVGELAAGVAHEINNSIMVILGFAQVLKREMAPQGESLDDVQTIEKEAKRCRDIVQQLLHFARPQPLKLGWYDIHEAIENSLHLLEHQIT
ncbi:MAG: HAMP domain-containing protein, partial [Nitrospinota bacterium]